MILLASDLDGTLVKNDKVRQEEIDAIKKLRRNGHKFIISTGRSLEGVNELLNEYDIEYDYLLLCNGGLIIDSKGEILEDKYIRNEVGTSILNEFYDYGNCLVYLDDLKNTILIRNDDNDNSQVVEMFDYFSKIIERDEAINKKEDYKIISVFTTDKSHERAEEIRKIISEKYSQDLEVYRNQFFVDIAPKNCSKGAGLQKILEIEERTAKDLHVVGDSFNDISMFKITDNSYTFYDVEEEIKSTAKNLVHCVSDVIDIIN